MNKRIAFAFVIMLLAGVMAASINVRIAKASTVHIITLYGSAFVSPTGWGLASQAETTPGPTITVDQGDMINLTLVSEDHVTHEFYIDYNKDGIPDDSEPVQSFSSTATFSFTASVNGTFTYYCAIHPEIMFGTFVVNTVIPEFPSTPILVLFMMAMLIAAAAYKKREYR